MSNANEIVEGNKLIAEFMGGKLKNYSISNAEFYSGLSHGKQLMPATLRYHTDWNWIMPVVEKIEKDNIYRVMILLRCCDICHTDGTDNILEVTARKTKIEAVWIAVTEFIKWYNSNKK